VRAIRAALVFAESRYAASLAVICLFAACLRAIARIVRGQDDFWVSGYLLHFELAHSLAQGHGYALDGVATAFRVPLYPMALAAVSGGEKLFWAVLAFNTIVSTLIVVAGAILTADLFGKRAALIAGVILAIYPYYVVHDMTMSELPLFTLLTLVGTIALLRAWRGGSLPLAASAGILFGLALLTRATLLPFLFVAALWLALVPGRAAGRQRGIAMALLLSAAALATVSPWLAYSQKVVGAPVLGTETGMALFGGNNAQTFSHYPQGSIDESRAAAYAALSPADKAALERLHPDPLAEGRWLRARALNWIAANPQEAALGAVRKVAAAFGPLPSPRKRAGADLAHALSYGPILLLALWGMWAARAHWREHLPIYAQIACFAAVTALIWGHTSHRSFLDVYLITFAAFALSRLPLVRDVAAS